MSGVEEEGFIDFEEWFYEWWEDDNMMWLMWLIVELIGEVLKLGDEFWGDWWYFLAFVFWGVCMLEVMENGEVWGLGELLVLGGGF
jgi:hypothetical protein